MYFIKGLIFGTTIGVLYGFINFYLIYPQSLKGVDSLFNWAIHGFLFSLFYLMFQEIYKKFRRDIPGIGVLVSLGAISGLLSCSFNLIVLLYVELFERDRIDNLAILTSNNQLVASMVRYSSGFILIGAIVGYIFWLRSNTGSHLKS